MPHSEWSYGLPYAPLLALAVLFGLLKFLQSGQVPQAWAGARGFQSLAAGSTCIKRDGCGIRRTDRTPLLDFLRLPPCIQGKARFEHPQNQVLCLQNRVLCFQAHVSFAQAAILGGCELD